MTNRTEIRRKLTDLKQQYGGESVFQALTDPDSADADRLTEGELMQLQQATEVLDNEEIAHKLTGDESRAVEIGSPSTTASGGSITLVSRARPLTPSANDDLQDYDPMRRVTADEIENPPLGVSDDTLVGYELGERPPEDVIDRYQLDVENDTLPRGIEETSRGTAEMQSAGLSNSGTDVLLRLDVFADRDGSTEFPYTIPNADVNGVPRRVVQEANEAIVDDLGDENQYTMQRPVGTARFDDSRDPPRFIAFDPADALPFDLLDDDDSGTSMFEVVVGRQGSLNVYEVEGVSRLSGLRNDARGIVYDEIGDARQYERGETVGQVRILGTDDGKMVDRFDPRDDLVSVMDYETNIDPRRQSTRDVTASDISFRFDDDDLNRQAINTALEILQAEFGSPTEFADNTVVGQVAFDKLSPDEYIVTGVNQRLEGEPDDRQDVLETDLGGLSPEVEDDDDDEQEQQQQRSTQGTLGGDSPLDPGEFPTEPDAAAERKREQLRREEQQQDLEGDAPEFDPAADRRERERRERRAERTEEQLAEDQVDLLGENIESDDVLPAEQVGDDDDNQPGLSAFGDDGNGDDSGN